jgi:hypothetical protein
VPEWYQRRFLFGGATRFRYLDLSPETVRSPGGKVYQRRALLRWGPARCFCRDDLYTVKLGNWSTDGIERRFFGRVDHDGERAVAFFANYGLREGAGKAYQDLVIYMDAQRLRTPRGLDWLTRAAGASDNRLALIALQSVFQLHTTMWTEGVWEVVHARTSPTKFLLTDGPVTFYNAGAFPGSKDCAYPQDVDLTDVGTRTIFPLGSEACLIITHLQLVRDPWINPRRRRVNARVYAPTLMNLLDVQFGRELDEDEVLRINVILKRRATRYIAAVDEEWLYPERHASTTHWSNLDQDWFLLPHLYKVKFTGETVIGYKDGRSWAMDEYGRQPSDPNYRDERLHQREWKRHLEARKAWAMKRRGKSVAHVYDFDEAGDATMAFDITALRKGMRGAPPGASGPSGRLSHP